MTLATTTTKTGLGMVCTNHIPDALLPCNRPFLKMFEKRFGDA